MCCDAPPRSRSFEVTTNFVGFGPRPLSVSRGRASDVPTTPDPFFGLQAPPAAEGTHGSSHCLACGAHTPPLPASTTEILAGPPLVGSEGGTPYPTHHGGLSQYEVNTATAGGQPTDVTAAIVSPVDVETQRRLDCGKPRGASEEMWADCGLSAQAMETMSIGSLSGFASEDQSRSQPYTTNDPEEACTDPAVIPVGDSVWCNEGVENVQEADLVNDVATVNHPTLCGDLRLFEGEPEGAGLCLAEDESTNAGASLGLTDDYLMGAAEALMSSSPLDGELGEEYVDIV